MKTALLINAHEEYLFSKGHLNASFLEKIETHLLERGYEVLKTTMKEELNVECELDKHKKADLIVLQSPVNWMGVPWSFKKYMDLVYTAGMDGSLCTGDGRSSSNPKSGYGTGGALSGKKYMLSLTFNAPREAFGDQKEYLFQGRSVDDLFFPQHMNFRFFGMEALPTFVSYDVMKNPQIMEDFERLAQHLEKYL